MLNSPKHAVHIGVTIFKKWAIGWLCNSFAVLLEREQKTKKAAKVIDLVFDCMDKS